MIYDPLRKKYVTATPEERVRQWFIVFLHNTIGAPMHLMMSEVGFEYGQKRYRADILIYDREAKPLAVVECKAANVKINKDVAEQALRYNAVLGVRYIFLTNGDLTFIYRLVEGNFVPCQSIPTYEQMLCQ